MNITKKSDKIKTSVVEKIRKGYSFMGEKKKYSNMTTLMGAAFLMATSAIGPGFLTQTSTFTAQYKSIFALVIICTILLDVTTQLNIWSVIGVSGMRGQDIANKVLPGLGYFIAFMVALGGLAFNIGNVGGGALGTQRIDSDTDDGWNLYRGNHRNPDLPLQGREGQHG